VLEHVQDIEASVREAIRVLRPGGKLLAFMPNFNSFYEGHYNAFWLPSMSKGLARRYVKSILHRDPSFVDEMNFTTPSMFAKYLNAPECRGEILFSGKGVLLGGLFAVHNLLNHGSTFYPQLAAWRRFLGHRLLRLTFGLPLHFMALLLAATGFATNFALILTKRGLPNGETSGTHVASGIQSGLTPS
jgi:SAM-dependent methyltransferase